MDQAAIPSLRSPALRPPVRADERGPARCDDPAKQERDGSADHSFDPKRQSFLVDS